MFTFGRHLASPFFTGFTIPYTRSMNRYFFIPATLLINVRVLLNHLIVIPWLKRTIPNIFRSL